ncbi:unnamed protein product [Chondrus crispus]|uniref:Uncharacterized protein n=1 Tax=Chondrus crispus TaxID=2769 RepID=R7Q7R9_CHOCR|nr:unnamed protein product [Chondrus crispus]CDF34587.1 unnamed protein product [Chondrus crispus]|eukprot:XP_005714406.1 unnamed protein product [Chondrus crispus]
MDKPMGLLSSKRRQESLVWSRFLCSTNFVRFSCS